MPKPKQKPAPVGLSKNNWEDIGWSVQLRFNQCLTGTRQARILNNILKRIGNDGQLAWERGTAGR